MTWHGAAAVADANIRNIDVVKVAAIDNQRLTTTHAVTDNDPIRTVNVHSSPLQLERFVNRHKRRWFAAVVDNAPVLRRARGRRVFRAERTRGHLPATIDQGAGRWAALVAWCGLGERRFRQFAT